MDYTEEQITQIAEDAIDALCLSVQKAVGQTDGDFASIYFSRPQFMNQIKDYIRDEIKEVAWLKKHSKTLEDFAATRLFVEDLRVTHPDEFPENESPVPGMVYADIYWIQIIQNGSFYTILGNEPMESRSLQEIETALFNYTSTL